MYLNNQVKENLTRLFESSIEVFNNRTIENIIDSSIKSNPQAFNLGIGVLTSLFDSNEIKRLKNSKKNQKLKDLYNKTVSLDFNEIEIIESFKDQITNSFNAIKSSIQKNAHSYNSHVILIEHDYEPIASFSGYGSGDYSVLTAPEYITVNFEENVFSHKGQVDYKIWNDLIDLEELLDELDLTDSLWYNSSEIQAIRDAYKYKTYLFLYEAFYQLGATLFQGIPIKSPLFIFGKEHDCEAINIFIHE